MRGRRAFSLLEILVTLSILGILVAVLGNSYQRWSTRYRVEDGIKRLHTQLLDARAKAMTRKRVVFLSFSGSVLDAAQDTAPAPDGNGERTTADLPLWQESTAPLAIRERAQGEAEVNALSLRFDTAGTLTTDANNGTPWSGSIRLVSEVSADFDCIAVTDGLRISLGKYDGTQCQAR